MAYTQFDKYTIFFLLLRIIEASGLCSFKATIFT